MQSIQQHEQIKVIAPKNIKIIHIEHIDTINAHIL